MSLLSIDWLFFAPCSHAAYYPPERSRLLSIQRIHILGGSGSGTTTLGRALSQAMGCAHFDTDDYFWYPTEPPYQNERPIPERQKLLKVSFASTSSWVSSGAMCGWGDFAIAMYDLVVFLWIPTELRLERLAERELEEIGPEIHGPATPQHANFTEFMEWASNYDKRGPEMRSKVQHDLWLPSLTCPVLRLEKPATLEENLAAVMKVIQGDEN